MSAELLEVVSEARNLLARAGNDFFWSWWRDQRAALDEMDRLMAKIRRGRVPRLTLDQLFAPTGSIGEVAISSGWGDEYLRVAAKYDTVVARASRLWWRFW
jgi:hypothetical protein